MRQGEQILMFVDTPKGPTKLEETHWQSTWSGPFSHLFRGILVVVAIADHHIGRFPSESCMNTFEAVLSRHFTGTVDILGLEDITESIEHHFRQGRNQMSAGHQDVDAVFPKQRPIVRSNRKEFDALPLFDDVQRF